jgi:serine phosphatase RsbU (regulator of sigma subunit)
MGSPCARKCHATSGRFERKSWQAWLRYDPYSNGVVEAENGFEKQFGIERLINLVINNRDRPASEILMVAEKNLLDYSQVKAASSDVTLIILKRS